MHLQLSIYRVENGWVIKKPKCNAEGWEYEAVTWYGEDGSYKEAKAVKDILYTVLNELESPQLMSDHNERYVKVSIMKRRDLA